MTWINHPAYARVRDELVRKFRTRARYFGRTEPLIFLCGGHESPRREEIRKFLSRHTDAQVFYAEEVWPGVREDGVDALQMEGRLADLADLVIIIVESAGTFTELGAFSMHDGLAPKVLPILNRDFQSAESFINTGPIRLLDQRSKFKPAIHADFNVILTSATEILARTSLIPRKRARSLTDKDLASSPRHLLGFLVDLVRIAQPLTERDILFYVREVAGSAPPATKELLQVAIALRLVVRAEVLTPTTPKRYYFTPPDTPWLTRGTCQQVRDTSPVKSM